MGAEVMELLHQLNKEDGRTIVMVTHNEEQAKQTSAPSASSTDVRWNNYCLVNCQLLIINYQ